jgi:hypothetical protein
LVTSHPESKELHRQGDYWLTAKLSVWTDAGACYYEAVANDSPLGKCYSELLMLLRGDLQTEAQLFGSLICIVIVTSKLKAPRRVRCESSRSDLINRSPSTPNSSGSF